MRAPDSIPLPGGGWLELDVPRVMGVLNVTPDSFSDGGRYVEVDLAVRRAEHMVAAGAAILDVGGESTRPGARRVPDEEETARVVPVIERVVGLGVPVSIDTRKARVAEAALAAGATIVNDVSGLADERMAAVAAAVGAPVIVGHIQGTPETMQQRPAYEDVVAEVAAALRAGRDRALAAGVAPTAVLVDPGIGFGKTLAHNLQLLRGLARLTEVGPVVVGVSRKSMLGALLDGRPPEERLAGGLGAAVWSALQGASVIRTHDVLATVDALRVVAAIRRA